MKRKRFILLMLFNPPEVDAPTNVALVFPTILEPVLNTAALDTDECIT
jgi:hypothetical protein